jgi:hypothetical protein
MEKAGVPICRVHLRRVLHAGQDDQSAARDMLGSIYKINEAV